MKNKKIQKTKIVRYLILLTVFLCACSNNKDQEIISRRLSSSEVFQLQYEALEDYLTNGKRPRGSNDWEKGFYPKEELTKEQILQVLDKQYKEIPKEWYTPLKEELSVKETKKTAKNALEKYVKLDTEIEQSYILYTSAIPLNEGLSEDVFSNTFQISFHMKNGEYDYSFQLAADDGRLLIWKRYPKDYFTKEHYLEARKIMNTQVTADSFQELSEERIKEIAVNYVKEFFVSEGEILPSNIWIEKERGEEASDRKVSIKKANRTYDIFISKKDGEVCGVEVKY